ncbi:hypothetical protein [Janibacter sp. G56]|uniref:hypothetical protein n=1 Tax=Janibacter sp. G56 TaxID=3418717 RepID=UPI003D0120D1
MDTHGDPAMDGGLLLVRADPEHAIRWVTRGVVPAHVSGFGSWSAITAAGPRTLAAPPYDDAREVLAARPPGARTRPALGFFVIGGNAVVSVQPSPWRATRRWLVWVPGSGVVRSKLPGLRPGDLLRVAETRTPEAGRSLVELLRRSHGDAIWWLVDLLRVLGLPGERLLTDPASAQEGDLVEPSPSNVARFDATVREVLAEQALANRATLEDER